jgi:hypothetical protein
MRCITLIGTIVLLGLAAYAAVDNSVTGKWACTSTHEQGTTVDFTLVIKDDGAKLSASMIFAQTGDEAPLSDVVLDGNSLSFKLQINPQETVQINTKINGRNMEGTFKGKDSGSGTLKGVKQD